MGILSFLHSIPAPEPKGESQDAHPIDPGRCAECSGWEVSRLLEKSPIRLERQWRNPYGKPDPSCPFCHTLIEAAKDTKLYFDLGHEVLDDDSHVDSRTGKRVYFSRLTSRGDADPSRCFYALADADTSDVTPNEECLLFGRRVGPLIDIPLLQNWFDSCQHSHVATCHPSVGPQDAFSLELRVIDTETRQLAYIKAHVPYVTLSYVWGGPEIPQLKLESKTFSRLFCNGGLANHHQDIPTTIKDAINLCQALQRRYLWVDALCIIQDDRDDQRKLIQAMHKIYANADFTIVAASGPDSWSGLPGVSERRKARQKVRKLDGRDFVIGLSGTKDIKFSDWNQRAWTLQEKYHSRRLLYIMHDQVLFRCLSSTWREDRYLEALPCADLRYLGEEYFDTLTMKRRIEVNGQAKHPFSRYYAQNPDHDSEPTGDETTSPMSHFQDLVSDYTSRNLSDPSDTLNAFAGISHQLSLYLGCNLIWGLPESFFDVALTFHSYSRRPWEDAGFPSWSWCGWFESWPSRSALRKGLDYHSPPSAFYSEVEWFVVAGGQYVKIQNSGIAREEVPSDLSALRASWKPSPCPPLKELPPGLTPAESKRLLVFQTSCAFAPIQISQWEGEANLLTIDGKYSLQGKLDVKSLDAVSRGSEDRGTMEFILIATHAAKIRRQSGKCYVGELGELMIMAIVTNERGISRRVGILDCSVKGEAWMLYEPVWRTVFML